MRILRILSVVLSAAVLISGTVLYFTSRGKDDAPVITCSERTTITTTVDATDEELLAFVSAYDKQDGDISDRIRIIRKKYFVDPSDKTTVITFAVCDSDNNVTKIRRKLVLSDYHSPRISLSNDLILPSGYTYALSQYVSAYDVIDGDLTEYVKLISNDFTNSNGIYPVNIKVSNTMGDSTDITVNAIITSEDYFNVKVRLDDYACYAVVGEEIDYESKISDIYNKTTQKYDLDDIVIDASGVDISTPGVYDAYYRILDGEDIITMTRLVVIVTED